MRRMMVVATMMLAVFAISGCNKSGPPKLTEVEGTVLLDGKPLPNAQVEFQPDLPKLKGEYNSFAVTDEKGHFQMVCAHMQQPGAAIAKHRVLISDPPMPGEYRGMDAEAQAKQESYLAGLKNRPIPPKYGAANTTPLTVDVTADKKTYEFNLSRE